MPIIQSKKQQAYAELIAQNRIKIGKYIHTINPSSLPAIQRQQLWAGIKRKNPELADCLKNDPNIAAIKQSFSAYVVFTEAEIDDYLKS